MEYISAEEVDLVKFLIRDNCVGRTSMELCHFWMQAWIYEADCIHNLHTLQHAATQAYTPRNMKQVVFFIVDVTNVSQYPQFYLVLRYDHTHNRIFLTNVKNTIIICD